METESTSVVTYYLVDKNNPSNMRPVHKRVDYDILYFRDGIAFFLLYNDTECFSVPLGLLISVI